MSHAAILLSPNCPNTLLLLSSAQGLLHQDVLPKKSGWRLESQETVAHVCVSLFKRVPISWSHPIKGDIDPANPCDAQSDLLLAQFHAAIGDATRSAKP